MWLSERLNDGVSGAAQRPNQLRRAFEHRPDREPLRVLSHAGGADLAAGAREPLCYLPAIDGLGRQTEALVEVLDGIELEFGLLGATLQRLLDADGPAVAAVRQGTLRGVPQTFGLAGDALDA